MHLVEFRGNIIISLLDDKQSDDSVQVRDKRFEKDLSFALSHNTARMKIETHNRLETDTLHASIHPLHLSLLHLHFLIMTQNARHHALRHLRIVLASRSKSCTKLIQNPWNRDQGS